MLRPISHQDAGLPDTFTCRGLYPRKVRTPEEEELSNLRGVLADWGPAKAIECEYEPSVVWRVWAEGFQGEGERKAA